jgi:hypothetical protein
LGTRPVRSRGSSARGTAWPSANFIAVLPSRLVREFNTRRFRGVNAPTVTATDGQRLYTFLPGGPGQTDQSQMVGSGFVNQLRQFAQACAAPWPLD